MATAADIQYPEVEVAIKRMDGTRAVQKIQKRTHYMVSLFHDSANDDEVYAREVVVGADTAPKAKAFVKANLLKAGETVESASKMGFQDAAVLKLNGWEIHNA